MPEDYPWYAVASGSDPLQGDFLDACPILVPPPDIDLALFDPNAQTPITVGWQMYDVVVKSQSCDLEQANLDLVLLCPRWPLDRLEQASDFFKSTRGKEELRRGNVPGHHMLAASDLPGLEQPVQVVDFRSVSSLPPGFLQRLAASRGDRLRLLPPSREHLSQAFARFFMRVGLPVNIPPFRKGAGNP